MHDRLMAGRGQQTPKGRHVAHAERVDHRQLASRRDLHQAQLRPVGVFGDELRIESNIGRGADRITKLDEISIGGDQFVRHRYSVRTAWAVCKFQRNSHDSSKKIGSKIAKL